MTKISWADKTWNPTVGCTRASPGCDGCYARILHDRRHEAWKNGWENAPVQYHEPFEANIQLKPERLGMPLAWREPHKVFVDSVSDLFHPNVPADFIDEVFAVMALAKRHTFIVLTKRPGRMSRYVNSRRSAPDPGGPFHVSGPLREAIARLSVERGIFRPPTSPSPLASPLPNVWLGVSAEDQLRYDRRVARLCTVPAAVRLISFEPLLGPIDVHSVRHGSDPDLSMFEFGAIDWAIVGGESGPGYREMDPDWARRIRDACRAEGVAFWGKQASGTTPEAELPPDLRIRGYPETAEATRGAS